ncbi:hypothetical protein U9M48_013604 [Paspalum notatum var. saurae]|uniref:Uncharacterized protein n=1 Tax=Paspalum notatum var. saurae TaxID=547442 RepID=A0AAQ3WJP9_PASNO
MLRESFTSPHYTLYHYICPLIHTSQGRSKGVFIVLSDEEVRLWRLETPGDLVPSRAAWPSLGSTASLHPTVHIAPPRRL